MRDKHMIHRPEVTQVIRMKFRDEEMTIKLVNLIVKGILIYVVFTGGFFGTPLSFLYKTQNFEKAH